MIPSAPVSSLPLEELAQAAERAADLARAEVLPRFRDVAVEIKSDGSPVTEADRAAEQAIRAALHPAQTKALYFVSRGDGSHVFSETFEEHNRAVAKYQLGR